MNYARQIKFNYGLFRAWENGRLRSLVKGMCFTLGYQVYYAAPPKQWKIIRP